MLRLIGWLITLWVFVTFVLPIGGAALLLLIIELGK